MPVRMGECPTPKGKSGRGRPIERGLAQLEARSGLVLFRVNIPKRAGLEFYPRSDFGVESVVQAHLQEAVDGGAAKPARLAFSLGPAAGKLESERRPRGLRQTRGRRQTGDGEEDEPKRFHSAAQYIEGLGERVSGTSQFGVRES